MQNGVRTNSTARGLRIARQYYRRNGALLYRGRF